MKAALISEIAVHSHDPHVRYNACKAMAKGFAGSRSSDELRVLDARIFCANILHSYWYSLCERYKVKLHLKDSSYLTTELEPDAILLAEELGKLITLFPIEDAGFLIGSVYTVMLPSTLRSSLGAYYTPPPLVSRLLDLAENAGVDFGSATVIDPACGGGAFLAPVALRMLKSMPTASAEWKVECIANRLRGIEIDPFAAWMSGVILEASVLPECIKAGRRLPDIVTIGDSLAISNVGTFDLVIGNPPYGKKKLTPEMRNAFSRSLYGHANLYGLFTDLALQLSSKNGFIAYLTPTSFLGGQYFKALRELLTSETVVDAIDFISDRNGVFDDVLQETLLTVYRKSKVARPAKISLIAPQGLNSALVEFIGEASIPLSGEPWIIPRRIGDANFVSKLEGMTTRLADLGYSVSTGQLVWNRHKDQLHTKLAKGILPIIWAESVTSKGFEFSASRRNHVPYIELMSKQQHLVTMDSCILMQRTTAKEQARRLIPALLPQEFIDSHGGVVVENHLNMISCKGLDIALVSANTVCTLLSTNAVDRVFRCINGSVAVSAYELNALPLPNARQLIELETFINSGHSQLDIEKKVSEYYGY